MNQPNWLPIEAILAFHAASLARFGGADGIRDTGLLDSAINRPKQLFNYEKPDIFEMAAAYISGIVKNHPFIDGNKRTGFLAAYTFLGINGWQLEASEIDATLQVLALADSRLSDDELTIWLRNSCSKKV